MPKGQSPSNRIDEETRRLIGDDLVGGMSRRATSRKWGISQDTASRIAQERGLGNAQPPELSMGSKIFMATVKERRAKLKMALLEDVDRLRDRAWSEYTRTVAGKDGPYEITEDLPPLGEVRNCYAAIGVALSGYAKLEALDTDTNKDDEAKSVIGDILSGLAKVNAELDEREANGQYGRDLPEDEVMSNVVKGEVVSPDEAAGR